MHDRNRAASQFRRVAIVFVTSVGGTACFPELGEYRSDIGAGGGGGSTTSAGGGGAGTGANCPTASADSPPILIGNEGANALLAMAVDPMTGKIAVAGTFRGTLNLGDEDLSVPAGNVGVFLAQYDKEGGKPDWSRALVSYDPSLPSGLGNVSLAYDLAGNLVAAGSYTGQVDWDGTPVTNVNYPDIFVVKLDPVGGTIWGKTVGDANSALSNSVAVDPATGSVLLVGQFNVTLDFENGCPVLSTPAAGDTDLFVAMLSGDGDCLQAAQFGDGDFQLGTSGAFTGSGVVLSGLFRGALDFAPLSTLVSRAPSKRFEAFVASLDTSLAGVAAVRVGIQDEFANGAVSVLPQADESIVYAGTLVPPTFVPGSEPGYGGLDWVMGRTGGSTTPMASNVFGGPGLDAGSAVAHPDGSGFLAFGSFELNARFGDLPTFTANSRDGFVAELDDDFAPRCVEQFGGNGDQGVSAIGFDPDHEVIAGNFTEAILLDGIPHPSSGSTDIFLYRRPRLSP